MHLEIILPVSRAAAFIVSPSFIRTAGWRLFYLK
jgi:hypothetical protein